LPDCALFCPIKSICGVEQILSEEVIFSDRSVVL
jgi:hypothetical protein